MRYRFQSGEHLRVSIAVLPGVSGEVNGEPTN